MSAKMKRYNLYLSKYQIDVFMQVSQEKGISVSELIRRALDEYIERHGLGDVTIKSSKEVEEHDVSN